MNIFSAQFSPEEDGAAEVCRDETVRDSICPNAESQLTAKQTSKHHATKGMVLRRDNTAGKL
ncbi:hypothetical protein NZK35_19145 [Stieleria sp. ICT_E10.1]|uniref:hypothetical protein n=1 Tax=Stieleria sedimenti TaxID=2976331 RepID=UPI00217F8A05|nr:hypothetical protein [Stieleria sedimenti]MCS7468773.1 hypothetical protein [Stieleria sedimenti]